VRPSGRSLAAAVASFALALWLRLRLLHAPPYGDEGLHYWTARHFAAVPPNVTDVDGLSWFHPWWIVWQRPAYYVLLHPFALHGFEAFRVGHALWSSLLPVAAFALLRAHGASRPAAAGAGLFAAAFPPFVTWGGLALMDEPMAVLFAAALWALRLRRDVLAGALFVAEAWTKETAFIGLAGVLAATLFRGWVAGRNRLDPFRLDRPSAALLLAAPVALLPLQVSLVAGLDTIGAASGWRGVALLDPLWVAPWLALLCVAGLRWRASRSLCAVSLGLGLAFLALNGVLHRAVEAWYLVLPQVLAGCAALATVDAAVRAPRPHGSHRSRRPLLPVAAAVLVVALLAAAVLLPASAAKAAVLSPSSGQPVPSLAETFRYETRVRDRGQVDAVAALRLDGARPVVAVDVPYPLDLHPLSERAGHVYVDSAAVRESVRSYGVERFAAMAGQDGAMLLVRQTGLPFAAALEEAYGPCRVLDDAGYRVYESWRCPDGVEVLRRWQEARS
jgi:hypothetical protein